MAQARPKSPCSKAVSKISGTAVWWLTGAPLMVTYSSSKTLSRDRGDERDQHEHRAEAREGDVDEARPSAGAVDLGGLVQLARDADQAGEEDHHEVAEALPHGHHHRRHQAPRPLAEPVHRAGTSQPSTWLKSPPSSSSSSRQAIAATIVGVTTGRNSHARKPHAHRSPAWTSRAAARASAMSTGVTSRYRKLLPRQNQNFSSTSRRR